MDLDSFPAVARVIAQARQDQDVLAVMLFGSRARGEAHAQSDTDVCLVLGPGVESREAATRKRLDYLSATDLDLSIFQLLPLHIRSRVLKEGQVLFVRDEDSLYALAARTARAFEHFRHVQRRYLDEIARG
jgi:predicted nucleotidyltransferase